MNLHFKKGKLKMFSTPELCHSALVDLFKEPHNYDLPEGFTRRWEKYKASRKIDEGKKRLTGALATEGADALSVSGYKAHLIYRLLCGYPPTLPASYALSKRALT